MLFCSVDLQLLRVKQNFNLEDKLVWTFDLTESSVRKLSIN